MRAITPIKVAAVIAMLTVAACGSDATSNSESDDTTGTTADMPVTVPEPSPSGPSAPASGSVPTSDSDPSAAFEELVAAAEAEGTLLLYNSNVTEIRDALVEAFEAEYDIDVEVMPTESSGLMVQRYLAEEDAGGSPADLVMVTETLFMTDPEHEDLFVRPTDIDIPSIAGYDEKYILPNGVIYSITPWGLCWNSDQVDGESIDTFADVANVLSDSGVRVSGLNPANASSVLMVWSQVVDNSSPDAVSAFFASDPIFTETNGAAGEFVRSGEAGLQFPCTWNISVGAAEVGAPVEFKQIEPVTSGAEFVGGIPVAAPNPNAARLFLDFTLSEAGQTALHTTGVSATPLDVAIPGAGDPGAYEPFTRDQQLSALERRDEILQTLGVSG